MIVMTIRDAITAAPSIIELNKRKLPAKTAYHLAKISRHINSELEKFEKMRVKLIKSLGEEIMTLKSSPEDPLNMNVQVPTGEYKVKDENLAAFHRDIAELHAVEISIDLNPVPIAALGPDFQVEPGLLMHCTSIIVE